MAVTNSGDNALKIKKPSYIVLTEYTGDETDGTPAGDSFVLEEVVRDTTSISQDDNDETKIERETNDIPIDWVISLGDYNIEAEVANVSNEMLQALLGWTETGDGMTAPTQYTDRYVQFDIAFYDGDDLVAFRVHKMKLSSSLLFESLNSNLGRIKLAGKAVVVSVSETTTNDDGTESTTTTDRIISKISGYTLPTEETES